MTKSFFIWDRVQRKRLYFEVNIFAFRLVNNVIIALCVAKQYPFLSFPSDLNKLIVNTNHKQIELRMPVCKLFPGPQVYRNHCHHLGIPIVRFGPFPQTAGLH